MAHDKTNPTITSMAKYIKHHINDMMLSEKEDILKMIVGSMSDNKIHTKGDGTQVKFDDMPKTTISMIYNYMKRKISDKQKQLQHISDGEEAV